MNNLRPMASTAGGALLRLLVSIEILIVAVLILDPICGCGGAGDAGDPVGMDLTRITAAIRAFDRDTRMHSPFEAGLTILVSPPPGSMDRWKGPYLAATELQDPWDDPYLIQQASPPDQSWYRIVSKGPDKVLGTGDDRARWISREGR